MTNNFVGGRNTVLEALQNKRVAVEDFLISESATGSRIDEAKTIADDRGISYRVVSSEQINQITGQGNHQGILIKIKEMHPHTLDDLLDMSSGTTNRRLFVLDELQDPVNLGKLARIAVFFGFSGIIKTRDRSAPLNNTVLKTSSGAAVRLPIAQVKNLDRALETLKEERFWLVGTIIDAEHSIEEIPKNRNLAIMLGHEGSGLRRLTRERADYLASISGAEEFDSLNVATAGAISAYALQSDQLEKE